jgi:DNA replication protein
MILQKLYENYGFNIEKILIKEAKKLKLSSSELNILLTIFSYNSKKVTFSIGSISRKTDYNQDEVAQTINSLIEKDFIEIVLETNNKVSREIILVDKTFAKITSLLRDEIELENSEKNSNNISKTIELIESRLDRLLRSQELDRIRLWYDTYNYSHDKIIKTINSINGKTTINYIEKLLNIDYEEREIDQSTNDLLDRVFKKL